MARRCALVKRSSMDRPPVGPWTVALAVPEPVANTAAVVRMVVAAELAAQVESSVPRGPSEPEPLAVDMMGPAVAAVPDQGKNQSSHTMTGYLENNATFSIPATCPILLLVLSF